MKKWQNLSVVALDYLYLLPPFMLISKLPLIVLQPARSFKDPTLLTTNDDFLPPLIFGVQTVYRDRKLFNVYLCQLKLNPIYMSDNYDHLIIINRRGYLPFLHFPLSQALHLLFMVGSSSNPGGQSGRHRPCFSPGSLIALRFVMRF